MLYFFLFRIMAALKSMNIFRYCSCCCIFCSFSCASYFCINVVTICWPIGFVGCFGCNILCILYNWDLIYGHDIFSQPQASDVLQTKQASSSVFYGARIGFYGILLACDTVGKMVRIVSWSSVDVPLNLFLILRIALHSLLVGVNVIA